MQKTSLLILAGLLLVSFTSYVVFTNLQYHEEKYHEYLARLADKVNASNTTWKAGVNQKFVNSDIDGVRAHCGALLDNNHGAEFETVSEVHDSIPESFDSRVIWGDRCPSTKEIRDQSNCGSCWAFGAVESLTDRHCIHLGQDIRLSAQDLLTCCGISCGFGCKGGYPIQAMKYYAKTGIVSGDLYGTTNWCQSYSFAPCSHHVDTDLYPPCTGELPTPKCQKSCDADSTYGKTFKQDTHKGSKAYAVAANEKSIQTEIMTNGPVEASFTVYEDFVNYKSGVYQYVGGKKLGGHAIKMIGWGVENGTPYWILVNSWNQTWGENGTFRIRRGVNEVGIESGIVTALPEY